MSKGLWLGLACALAFGGSALAAEGFSEVEYYRQLEEARLQEAQKARPSEPEPSLPSSSTSEFGCYREDAEAPANVIAVIPQYFHSRSDKSRYKLGGDRVEMSKGHANGFGATFVYNRKVNDWFSLGLLYEYAFMSVTSGIPVPRGSGDYNRESSRWNSHTVGLLPELNMGDFGRLQFSVAQSFDRASGYEEIAGNPRMDVDDYGANLTSLMAWYEKDFQLGCGGWSFSPYAGWRSLYVSIKDRNDLAAQTRGDDNYWVHLVSGGFKLNYQQGAYGFNLRGGVNHRNTGNKAPIFGNRAVAPGVVQFSHRANMDRTVGTMGVGASYAINRRAIMAAGYDAFFGKDTSSHMGTLSFIFPF